MQPNWFIGLPVSPEAWFDERVPPAPEGCRRFHRDDLHFTIAFLGAVNESAALAGFSALRWPLAPTRVTLGAVVPLGNRRRFSALSALLVDGRIVIEAAMQEARSAVWRAASAEADERPAKAHLTLARPHRSATPAQRDAALRWATGLQVEGVALMLDRVALYTWSTDRRDRQFRMVQQQSLQA